MVTVGCNADGDLNDVKFSQPMPWIGVYVAAASLVCALAMAADLIFGFRHRTFWFPNKFFSLNATSLTFIAVAIKLSVDLNTPMPRSQDQLSKLTSSALICAVMSHSMPSLGNMTNKDITMNIMALGILVFTVIVNVSIQLATGAIFVFWKEHILIIIFMFVVFTLLSFSSLTVPTTKEYLERKYRKKYELALRERRSGTDRTEIQRLREDLTKFWMMAHTCNPQFVMGRSVTCTASGFLCLLTAVTLAVAILRSYSLPGSPRFCDGDSDYKWSSVLVLVAQAVAVGVGTVAPAIRWFGAINYRCPTVEKMRCRKEFHVESYWIQSLKESKESPLSIQIENHHFRKLAHDVKRLKLDICIAAQCGIVLGSKVVRSLSVYFVSRILLCYASSRRFKKQNNRKVLDNDESTTESDPSSKPDLSRFVLHLEGEDELVEVMMKNNRDATDHWVEMGRRKQPKHLIKLIEETDVSDGFQRVIEFDSFQVPSLLQTEELPNSWSLPIATLTAIAVALLDTNPCMVKKLLSGVNEGLFYVRDIEKHLDNRDELVNMRKAADAVWLGVDLYRKWLDVDLLKLSGSPCEILRKLADIAKKKFFEMKHINFIVCLKQIPSVWPVKTLAANSMYRICQTMLLNYETRACEGSQRLFDTLQGIICDVICASLTNLPRIISIKCLSSAVEVRKLSVRDAVFDLGRTERILEIVYNKGVPDLNADQMAWVHGWRLFYTMSKPQTCTLSLSERDATDDDLQMISVE